MKTLAVLAATTVLAAAAPASFAAPSAPVISGVDASTTVVRFGDLDLNQAANVSKLYERIRRAARMVCSRRDPGYTDSPSAVATSLAEYRSCVQQAMDSTIKRIALPKLTAYADLQARAHHPARPGKSTIS